MSNESNRSYTLQIALVEAGHHKGPVEFTCSASSVSEAEGLAKTAYPEGVVLRVALDDARLYLPAMADEQRCNPIYYSNLELTHALECCDNLLGDYYRGLKRGGTMEWEDLDTTHDVMKVALPRLAEANRRVWDDELAREEKGECTTRTTTE